MPGLQQGYDPDSNHIRSGRGGGGTAAKDREGTGAQVEGRWENSPKVIWNIPESRVNKRSGCSRTLRNRDFGILENSPGPDYLLSKKKPFEAGSDRADLICIPARHVYGIARREVSTVLDPICLAIPLNGKSRVLCWKMSRGLQYATCFSKNPVAPT